MAKGTRKKAAQLLQQDYTFYEQLWYFYVHNRSKVQRRYKDLTRKFLAFNDKSENPDAYLREPQFHALEMYVFIKEFLGNKHMYEMFDDWRNHQNDFSDSSYYTIRRNGEMLLFDDLSVTEQNEEIFRQMEHYKEDYPNYIYALAMGLGKTTLIATCIFYEFLLANKYPADNRFCHNALVFAPDKTVLDALHEIMELIQENSGEKQVVPPEYRGVLYSKIKFHFLDETSTPLQTIDDSSFNIIISNTQKIILKQKHKEDTPTDQLFLGGGLLSTVYGDDEDDTGRLDETALKENQRFKKLCRLPQLGVYVDEAHHLFGSKLTDALRRSSKEEKAGDGGVTGGKTSLRFTINELHKKAKIVACYNYTGTPYVDRQILPEVVYAYGLSESIAQGYLKDADPIAFENVKDEEFLKAAIKIFWERYGGQTFEGLLPKLAIYAASIKEATDIVRPALERILTDLDIPISTILVNTGNSKDEDIRNFRNLDVIGTEGSQKQFIILVGKGKEGWNCRSLLGVALFRNPEKSPVFVLQATMRCLRQLTDHQLTATIFLSNETYKILSDELQKNFNMEITDLGKTSKKESKPYQVRVLPPIRTLKIKRVKHEYKLTETPYTTPISFGLSEIDTSVYAAKMIEKGSIRLNAHEKETIIDDIRDNIKYSAFTLVAEIARYLNNSCLLIARILHESIDGIDTILEYVNKYNEILYDYIIPSIFNSLYSIEVVQHTQDEEITLLKAPKDAGYYVFSGKEGLVITKAHNSFTPAEISKSFHADTYCFDSAPERECFLQYITSPKVQEIYFTGMFTANQGDLFIQYYDPESGRIRKYYPDFLARMVDGSYQLIEVKGDNKLDDPVVKAKEAAAAEMATASEMRYLMYAGSRLMKENVLETISEATQS